MRKDMGLVLGIFLVIIGAASYGVLATLVKLAYMDGFSTTEVTVSQYLLGLIAVGLIVLVNGRPKPALVSAVATDKFSGIKLTIGGTAYGLTGVFYYLSVNYIPVSISIILLMQTVWLGILLESMTLKKKPGKEKIVAIILILSGTVLATNAIDNINKLDFRGIAWGFMAALTYTISLGVSNKVGLSLPASKRSFWILLGASAAVLIFGSFNMSGTFTLSVFWKWGIILAVFGTILPPILLNKGLPKTGIGLGSILIAIEIPVSVSMAHLLLHEQVLISQWIGIAIIIASIVLINLKTLLAEINKDPKSLAVR